MDVTRGRASGVEGGKGKGEVTTPLVGGLCEFCTRLEHIGGRLFMLGDFPSFNDPAENFPSIF